MTLGPHDLVIWCWLCPSDGVQAVSHPSSTTALIGFFSLFDPEKRQAVEDEDEWDFTVLRN